MHNVVNFTTTVYDQLNPFNAGNLALYFAWVVSYMLTLMGIWRSRRALTRFCCFAVNQTFSVGILLSWTLTALLAYTYWWQSLVVAASAALLGWLLFSPRRPAADAGT